jgi:hypothetical protein
MGQVKAEKFSGITINEMSRKHDFMTTSAHYIHNCAAFKN